MRRFYLILLIFLYHGTCGATELSEFSKFKGGYEVVNKNGYVLLIDDNFLEIDGDLNNFKKNYLSSDDGDSLVSKYVESVDKKKEVVPFKPALTALLIANIPLNIPKAELLDSSLDVGFFIAENGVLIGGIVQFHAFSGVYMGSRFHKVVRLEFSGDFISERLQNIPEETLPNYFLK